MKKSEVIKNGNVMLNNVDTENKSAHAIAFVKWIFECTYYRPTENINEWKALHMGDGWIYLTTEDLYEMFLTGKSYL